MLILALDSTAQVGSVALCEDEILLGGCTLNTGHTHSETLLPTVEFLLKSCGKTVDDVDLFACTAGPGSFTGVRIGAATLKGLAFGKGKPCVGVSTPEALAYDAGILNGVICPAMNARRQQVYNALFLAKDGKLTRLCEDRALAIADLWPELLALAADHPVYFVGDGAELVMDFPTEPSPLDERFILLSRRLHPETGYAAAQVALAACREGKTVTDGELTPVYLRLSQAERVRLENEKQKANPTDGMF